jgi:hypothetical protein
LQPARIFQLYEESKMSILYWNAVALEANRRDFTDIPPGKKSEQGGPTLSSRALAITHLAMYDAYAGVVGGASFPRYLTGATIPMAAPGANLAAAVAAAAHATLSALFPRQKPHFDTAHQLAGLNGAGIMEGHSFGLAVASAILLDRKKDPSASDNGYAASTQHGRHRVDPAEPTQPYHGPFYGACSRPFASAANHVLNKPPAYGSAEYDEALNEVRGKGIAPELMGTLPTTYQKRTVDQTLIGVFWAYDGVSNLGTPPRLYNQIVRRIAIARGNDDGTNARLFALVNAAMGDAGIFAWREKYAHDVWRPVLGVREHDPSMGPAGPKAEDNIDNDCDPNWWPLGAPASNTKGKTNGTPPFPAYPSGHATFGAAAFQIVRLFYLGKTEAKKYKSDDLFDGLDFVSDEHNGVTTDNKGIIRPRHRRAFKKGLWQMIVENGLSRIYLGVHWSFDAFAYGSDGKPDVSQNIGGVPLGLAIAEDIFAAGGGLAPKRSTLAAPQQC